MGLTNFPNGITSFGQPVIGPPNIWLPKGATAYFVSPLSSAAAGSDGASGAAGTYDQPFRTAQYASNQVTAGNSTSQGAIIYCNPGVYAEQVTVANKYGIKFVGSGAALSRFDLTGVTGTTSIMPGGDQTAGPPALILASRSCAVTGFTFKVILNTYGIYMGDGTRVSASYNYASQDHQVYGNLFDGDGWAGLYGIVVDGLKNGKIFDNDFFKLGSGGCVVGSGQNEPTDSPVFTSNRIKACRGYGVRILAGNVVRNWMTGPGNVFEDDVTTALTNPVLYSAASGKNGYCGNFQLCANDFSMQSTDYQSGNFKATAGNTVNYVSVA